MKVLLGAAMALSAFPAFAHETSVSICELLQHPTRYDGKVIRTRGSTVAGTSGCGTVALWVEAHEGRFGADLGRPGRVPVNVIGVFHWRPSDQIPAVLTGLPQAGDH
jgi:hypothetical protein